MRLFRAAATRRKFSHRSTRCSLPRQCLHVILFAHGYDLKMRQDVGKSFQPVEHPRSGCPLSRGFFNGDGIEAAVPPFPSTGVDGYLVSRVGDTMQV
jgi:hypothetical protein